MKFAFYSSLKPSAKKAFDKGNGKHGKYAVDDKYIAVLDSHGRAQDWILVVKSKGKAIKEKIKGE